MTKPKVWRKKRTTRGSGRVVNRPEKITPRNLDREIRKNQLYYARVLLEAVLAFVLGLVWLRLGAVAGSLSALPIGLVVGLLILAIDKLIGHRSLELSILCLATILSYFLPIGIVL